MTASNWFKRIIVLAMFGMLDSAAFYGEAYTHFKDSMLKREVFGRISLAEILELFSPYFGVLFLLGYTVFVLFFFGFQK